MSIVVDLIRKICKRRPAGPAQEQGDLQPLDAMLGGDPTNPELIVRVARAYATAGQRATAIGLCRKAIGIQPSFSAASIMLALLLRQSLNVDGAIEVLQQARAAKPGDVEVLAQLRQLTGNGRVPMWHFSMMNDDRRNRAYEQAIAATVCPGYHVLEIGTGSGLLAMMSSRAGASLVSTCEMVAPVAEKARQIIEQNGYATTVTVIPKESAALQIPRDLPRAADVLVAEIVSSDLLGENMLDSYDDACARLLRPGARVLPAAASIMAQLAGSAELDPYLRVGEIAGFKLDGFNDFTPVSLFPQEFGIRLEMFSTGFEVFNFDFQTGRPIIA